MLRLGHIELRDSGVIFVYHELEKPQQNKYYSWGVKNGRASPIFDELTYDKALKEYNASRREAVVENAAETLKNNWKVFTDNGVWTIWNSLKCEAEVNGKAEIIKIL